MVKKVKEEQKPLNETNKVDEENKIAEIDKEDKETETEKSKENLTAFQLKERKKRTVFVGNVPVNATAK